MCYQHGNGRFQQIMTRSRILPLLLACALAGLVSGCAHRSVVHLERQPWAPQKTQVLKMTFLRFDYQIVEIDGKSGIKGKAFPVMDRVPEWARWIDEFRLTAYLSDEYGEVLMESEQPFLPGPFQENAVFNFDFLLDEESLKQGPVFVSFGYRMLLTESKDKPKNARHPFFASEGAVTR